MNDKKRLEELEKLNKIENKKRKHDQIMLNNFVNDIMGTKKRKLDPRINKIKEAIKDRLITEANILNSNLPFDEKVKLIEKLKILKNTERNTFEYYDLKYNLYKIINDDKRLTAEDRKLENKIKEKIVCNKSMKQRILNSNHTLEAKSIMFQKYLCMLDMSEFSEEYLKIKNWLDIVLSVPTSVKPIFNSNSIDELNTVIKCVYDKLNSNLFGQTGVKERILELIGSMFVNKDKKRNSICMVGEPGVGKTAFARHLAEALKLPFYQISLGGITDSSQIKGHSSTYIGAKPGQIINSLIHMKQLNGILLLDEFDKLKYKGSNVSNAFLDILDYTQNHEFRDEFMPEIPVDLSKLIILVSVNNIEDVNYIVADRMPLLFFKDYNIDDKVLIGLNYLIPRIELELGFLKGEVVISTEIMEYIVSKNSSENAGVRDLEKDLQKLFERINILKLTSSDINISYRIKFNSPFILTFDIVDNLLSSDI